jgi:exonuclease SbcC
MRRKTMILSKLHLENFKKYVSYEIEFGEGLIGIIGKNGSGKSTIFEAILFALYGEAKKRGNKELVRNANASSKDPVVVELEFEFESVLYKVIREFRGKALSANAKLYKNGSLTTTGAKEVTSAIVGLTKMSKDAFMHTLFASQKELTSLSTLNNEERKKMIRRLLGLEKIDFIESTLVEKSRELKREISAFDEVLLSAQDLEEKQEQIKAKESQKEALGKEVELKTKELDSIKLHEQKLKAELTILAKTKEQKLKLLSELELITNNKSLELLNEAKLIAEHHELEHKAQKLKELANVKADYLALRSELKNKEQLKVFQLKKEGLNKELTQLREQYTKAKADIATLQKACENHKELLFSAKNLEIELAMLQEQINAKHTIESELKAEIATEQKQIALTKQKIEKLKELGGDSACPTCTRPLLEEYDKVISSLVASVNETQEKKINEYQKQLQNVSTQKAAFEAQRKPKEKEFFDLSNAIKVIESKLKDLKIAQEHFKQVEQKGLKNKEELKALEQYSYDEKEHESLKKSFTELEPKYSHATSLETELKRAPLVNAELEKCIKNIADLSEKEKAKEAEFHLVIYEDVKHRHTLEEHEATLKTIESKTTLLNEKKVQMAHMDGEIKTIQNALQNNLMQQKKVRSKKEDLLDYEKIKTSLAEFKTKLNAKVAPRISALASEMYARITKGKYQHIEVSNDFDFFIYDEGKKYPIERFSGGEVDLANLVLRIAISKTLTELSGASSIGFLAFDEVFGSQDEARRMEILEAFHTIKEQYRQIFLISHEMEIKEMFEKVIEL